MDLHAIQYDYGINEELPPGLFGKYELHVESAADFADSSVWEGMQRLPLTGEETSAFLRIEKDWARLGSTARFLVSALTSQMGQSNSPVTESSDFFHFSAHACPLAVTSHALAQSSALPLRTPLSFPSSSFSACR